MSTAEHIVTAAFRLFYRQGFHATGVDQLSQEAGMTKKTLYRHFPTKEHLVAAALQYRDDAFMAQLSAHLSQAEVTARPLAYLDFIDRWTAQPDFHGCAFINAAAEYSPPALPPHQLAQAHKARLLTTLQDICREAGLSNPGEVAQQLFLIGEGLIVASQVNGHTPALAETAQRMAERLIQFARPQDAASPQR